MILRMAWRNTWRNRRRTGIVVTAVSVGIAGTLLSVAVNYGMIVQMVDTAIATELGHIQIHAAGYEADPALRLQLERAGAREMAALEELGAVRASARRVRGEGLVSSPRASAGVRVVGIEPSRESRISTIATSMTDGAYLGDGPRQVLLGEQLARRLEVGVGDKIVVSVQELSGDLTGEALRVAGLFRTPSSALDRGTIFIGLEAAQSLFGIGDSVTELVAVADSRRAVQGIRDALRARLVDVEVRSWDELQPVLVYLVDVFEQTAIYIYAAIFVAMAFGIANVLLMTVYERRREIGILRAIGYGRMRLVATISVEALLVTGMGLALGFVVALVTVWSLGDGIDLSAFAEGLTAYGIGTHIIPVLRGDDFWGPLMVAGFTAVLASVWPAWRAVRMRPADAVRQI